MEAERAWWHRAVLVLTRPVEVFASLRDDSEQAAGDRQDAVVALAFVGGVAAALATAGSTLDDLDALEIVVWLFAAGFAYAFVGYWVLGWGLSFVVPRLGGGGTRRRTRHVLAFALAPLMFALAAWGVFPPLLVALGAWSVGLLLLGLRVVYDWSYARAAAGVALAVVWLAALTVCVWGLLTLLGRGFE